MILCNGIYVKKKKKHCLTIISLGVSIHILASVCVFVPVVRGGRERKIPLGGFVSSLGRKNSRLHKTVTCYLSKANFICNLRLYAFLKIQ